MTGQDVASFAPTDLALGLALDRGNHPSGRGPLDLARELLERAKTTTDPRPLIEAARALLAEVGEDPGPLEARA